MLPTTKPLGARSIVEADIDVERALMALVIAVLTAREVGKLWSFGLAGIVVSTT